jgi:hypothetical protein
MASVWTAKFTRHNHPHGKTIKLAMPAVIVLKMPHDFFHRYRA